MKKPAITAGTSGRKYGKFKTVNLIDHTVQIKLYPKARTSKRKTSQIRLHGYNICFI